MVVTRSVAISTKERAMTGPTGGGETVDVHDADADGADSTELDWAHRFDIVARRHLPILQYALDAVAWIVSIPFATVARYDFELREVRPGGIALAVLIAVTLQLVIGFSLGLYRRRYHYGSFDEARMVAYSVAGTAAVSLVIARAFGGTLIPRSVPVVSAFLALVIASVVRYMVRIFEDRKLRPAVDRSEPVVVFGAGNAGAQITRTMLRSPASPYRPVALLDDDHRRAHLRLNGLRVEGTRRDLLRVAERHGARAVLIAIPTASGELLREITTPLVEGGLHVLVLPPVDELLGKVRLSDIRPVTIVDLLGRHPADIDVASISGYVRGRRVLVTGAGGSIGSELCRQLRQYEPAVLVMLDRDESGLHGTQLTLEGRALLDSPTLALADIRDRDRVFQVFDEHRPEVVFHAAALKHLTLLEHNPVEAWKTNVVGTRNVLEAAEAMGVAQLVNISTDKAADPASVLGFSKRICERLTADVAATTGLNFVSVRFGNVLGSKGSMLGTFEQQITAGGPVTVTDAEVSRYFMTVEEAVALTIQAGALGDPGQVLVLDMGASVRIFDIAKRLIEQAERPIEIVITGLRPGEKLHEVLLGSDEEDHRPHHPLISHVDVPPLDYEQVRAACSVNGRLVLSPTTLEAAASWGLGTPAHGGARPWRRMSPDDPGWS